MDNKEVIKRLEYIKKTNRPVVEMLNELINDLTKGVKNVERTNGLQTEE